MSELLDAFAIEAARFVEWTKEKRPKDADAVREALVRISSLYSAALHLPRAWTDELLDRPEVEETEFVKIVAHQSIPFDFYCEVLHPLAIPPEEPVTGSISDDIIDIYRHVMTGLLAYRQGLLAEARFEWAFNFAIHWGEHATGAIRALHAWLAVNAIDKLAKPPL